MMIDGIVFPPLLIIVLAEREKSRENERESLVLGKGWNTGGRWISHTDYAVRFASPVFCAKGRGGKNATAGSL